MLVALCRTGGGTVRWKQGDQPGDPCILPGQRGRLGQGEGSEGSRAQQLGKVPWGAGEVMAGPLVVDSVGRDACPKERDGRCEQEPGQWSPQACGTPHQPCCQRSHFPGTSGHQQMAPFSRGEWSLPWQTWPGETLASRDRQTAASGRVAASLPARHPLWQLLFVLLQRG